ncbi:hypothetical protein TUM12370_02770 [Salmonella enterica subsp. enterica serovar Choleraesuis]|nr:hypothetical protein TUM12370_02770 [Salmonella enterica subsp. enterica serovar Choleraesuis]
MMRLLIAVAALMPMVALAQPINTLNNPNLPGYQNPTLTRMNQQMNSQQLQQQSMLNQSVINNNSLQQQRLQSQLNSNSQRVLNSQPGQQVLPNNGSGMLNGGGQQRMLNQ